MSKKLSKLELMIEFEKLRILDFVMEYHNEEFCDEHFLKEIYAKAARLDVLQELKVEEE